MSTFTCSVVKLEIVDHPNADALEIAQIGLFQCVVRKGLYKTGDLGVYVPEAAIVPEETMKQFGFWDEEKNRGFLSGSRYDRVKACKLRGVLSQGVVFRIPEGKDWTLGQDVQEELGITKFVPEIPRHFFGQNMPKLAGQFYGYTPNFDVENLKRERNAFSEGEIVQVTEKIHGTCCIIGCYTDAAIVQYGLPIDGLYKGRIFVGTKNLTKRGVVYNPEDTTNNIYARIPHQLGLLDKVYDIVQEIVSSDWADSYPELGCFCLIGEIFGNKIQDLTYNMEPTFRAFAVYSSPIQNIGKFVQSNPRYHESLIKRHNIPWVPILYDGPFDESVKGLANGDSVLCPGQIREGIVIQSYERGSQRLKLVSEAYLLRKGNATEYE